MRAVLRARGLAQPIIDAAFLADPYPTYCRMREESPVCWSDEFFGGAWLLTRYDDVASVLRDARYSAQRVGGWVAAAEEFPGQLEDFRRVFARALLFRDGADHRRLRALIQPAFRPEALQKLESQVESILAGLLDAADPAQGFDAMASLACPLPLRVIAIILVALLNFKWATGHRD